MATILVMDDEPNFRSLIFNLFSSDHVVLETDDEQEGLVMTGICRPDLIITNRDLPSITNFDLIKSLRTASKRVKILATSSSLYRSDLYHSEEFAEMLRAGADCCLRKTVDIPTLVETVENLLSEEEEHRTSQVWQITSDVEQRLGKPIFVW